MHVLRLQIHITDACALSNRYRKNENQRIRFDFVCVIFFSLVRLLIIVLLHRFFFRSAAFFFLFAFFSQLPSKHTYIFRLSIDNIHNVLILYKCWNIFLACRNLCQSDHSSIRDARQIEQFVYLLQTIVRFLLH